MKRGIEKAYKAAQDGRRKQAVLRMPSLLPIVQKAGVVSLRYEIVWVCRSCVGYD
jgi:hypothetical protein